MSARCDRIQSLAPFAARGELDEGERAAIQNHLADCPSCMLAFEFELELQAELERHPLEALPDHYYRGVLEEIHRKLPPVRPDFRRRRDPIWVREMSASLFVAAIVLLWVVSVSGLPSRRSDEAGIVASPLKSLALSGREFADAAAAKISESMVFVQGVGFVAADSPILKIPSDLAELKLRPIVQMRF